MTYKNLKCAKISLIYALVVYLMLFKAPLG